MVETEYFGERKQCILDAKTWYGGVMRFEAIVPDARKPSWKSPVVWTLIKLRSRSIIQVLFQWFTKKISQLNTKKDLTNSNADSTPGRFSRGPRA